MTLLNIDNLRIYSQYILRPEYRICINIEMILFINDTY